VDIIFFGVSIKGKELYEALSSTEGFKVIHFADNDKAKQGGTYCGVPVVARRFDKFDPEEAFAVMVKCGVRNAFIPPTALRMLRSVQNPRGRYDIKLRSVGSGGEALGAETFEWGKSALGVSINEFYGQTECNLVVGSCAVIGMVKPGAIGKPIPGHTVAVIDPDGRPVKPGVLGQIAVKRPDPVMFLE
jgi:acetyl-CoA synthetase